MNRWERLEKVPAPVFTPKFGPLSRIRVLLNGTIVAGPFCATMFGDFGAEVIALERPTMPDPYRFQVPQVMGDNGQNISCAWIQNSRNKLDVALETNMKIPESKEIFLSLIKQVDVWIENMVWIEKLGITDEMLWKVNPKLVIAHISGFGRPAFGGIDKEMNRASYDPIGQAESGYSLLQGYPDRAPTYATQYIGDYVVALMAFSGILMALRVVEETGKGQIVEVAQAESMMRIMDDNWTAWANRGFLKQRFGTKIPFFQPGNTWKCKDGKYITIGAYGEIAYNRIMETLGLSLEEFPYRKAALGIEAVNSELGQKLHDRFSEYFVTHTAQEASDLLNSNRIGAAVLKTCEEVYNDLHWQQRNNWVKYTDLTTGKEVEAFGLHPKMSETPGHVWRGAPDLGQDTDVVLNRLLGYSEIEIAAFKEKGVVK
ncbi:putative acyl-CoA transferase/carnitine dehydratase [Desulfosporosinus orientis DSM 765]|uniref:Putative acyl-CoA transferase/carnitine dehydratase n=1 Tax=Desulfosporosinus orientis (strain ATCC 19365 / DSM 765 / NCIMB 8382 / VKM B-1628 / Singapore I) TaxID=768706 RepID=G7WID8_DESOD|nr:CoA transferase [Desulfosporosinus orientis]AET68586.1 putative acyl-CoA transferase/carnitine dehydratase [Desulfosporosinus orientis DSM 765]